MRHTVCILFGITLFLCTTIGAAQQPASAPNPPNAKKIENSYFENGYFRISPPEELPNIKPLPDGVQVSNKKIGITVAIHYIGTDQDGTNLLTHLTDPLFRTGFIAGFNQLTPRKFDPGTARFRTVADVSAFTIDAQRDTERPTSALRCVFLYKGGHEFRLTLEAPTIDDLQAYDSLLATVFEKIEIK